MPVSTLKKKKKLPKMVVMPASHTQHKTPTPFPAATPAEDKDEPPKGGESPPPPLIPIPHLLVHLPPGDHNLDVLGLHCWQP